MIRSARRLTVTKVEVICFRLVVGGREHLSCRTFNPLQASSWLVRPLEISPCNCRLDCLHLGDRRKDEPEKSGPMSRPTLLQSQTNALLTLLNLGQSPPSSNASAGPFPRPASPSTLVEDEPRGSLVWKVLILDELSKDVLATSLRVQDLREQGVTLHMCVAVAIPAPSRVVNSTSCYLHGFRQLHSPRPPLADVPAVYFVSPTLANIRRIAEVCLIYPKRLLRLTLSTGPEPTSLFLISSLLHLRPPSVPPRRASFPHPRRRPLRCNRPTHFIRPRSIP